MVRYEDYEDYEDIYRRLSQWADEVTSSMEYVISSASSGMQRWIQEALPSPYNLKEHRKYYQEYLKWLLNHFGTYPIIKVKRIEKRIFLSINTPLCRSPPVTLF